MLNAARSNSSTPSARVSIRQRKAAASKTRPTWIIIILKKPSLLPHYIITTQAPHHNPQMTTKIRWTRGFIATMSQCVGHNARKLINTLTAVH